MVSACSDSLRQGGLFWRGDCRRDCEFALCRPARAARDREIFWFVSSTKTFITLPVILDAMKHGEVGFDVYPYIAASSILLADRANHSERVRVTCSAALPDQAGRDLSDIAREMGVGLDETVARLSPAGAVYFMMDEADVQRVIKFPHTMIGSDGLPHDTHPHPRLWGTFPRVLGHYARDIGLFSLEEGVRRMTSLTADRKSVV